MRSPIIAALIALVFLCFTSNAQEKFKVGIIQYKSEKKVNDTFLPLMKHLAGKIGKEGVVDIVHEEDLGFRVNKGDYDLGIFTVFPYLKAKTDFPDLTVFATHLVDNEDHYKGYILTKKSIKDYSDLQGKSLLFVKESSTSGFKIPNGILIEHNINIENFEYGFSGDHNASLWALDSGRVDAIAVDDKRFKSFDGPKKSSFNKLSEFEVPYHAYVFSPGLDQEVKEEFMKVLFEEHKDPDAKPLFNNPLSVTQFVPRDDNYYNELRRFMRIVRVKPSMDVTINPSEDAMLVLGNKRDRIVLVEELIKQEMEKSHRFGEITIEEEGAVFNGVVDLFSTVDTVLNYIVKLNNKRIGNGKLNINGFDEKISLEFSDRVLKSLPLQSDLLFNGDDWFITYGTDDGINLNHYVFTVVLPDGRKVQLQPSDIKSATTLNVFFKEKSSFKKGSTVLIEYNPEGVGEVVVAVSSEDEDSNTYNIFSAEFWEGSGFWDKLGLIGSIIFAILSAFVAKVIADRKKRRFKNILYETNDLIKEYVEGHYKLESRLIEQKDFITQALEDGNITENQYLILNKRIEDMQNLIEFHHKGDVELADKQADEIKQIISDGKITEREFSRIMNIIKKGAAPTQPEPEN